VADVLLISCNITREPYPVYPLGMAMVAHAAREQGHRVTELDMLRMNLSCERVAEMAESLAPDVIGLSLRNIDNLDSCSLHAYVDYYDQLVRALREVSQAAIVLGGCGYSLFPEVLLERLGGDYGVVGEGEAAFCRLLEDVGMGKSPTDRILQGRVVVTNKMMAVPARDADLASYYLQEGGMLNVQSKRGCPLRCAYCNYPLLEGRTYRFRPPEDVVDEIDMLISVYGADFYAIADSVFNDQQGQYLSVVEELVRRGIHVPWMAFFRPQRFQREQVDLLRRSGLHAVEWGTDCATDATLEGMQKDFTWEEVRHSNRLFSESGIACAHFIIFGGPGETDDTVREGLDNIEKLDRCAVFAFLGVRILPGTAIQRRAVEEGVICSNQSLLEPVFYHSPDVRRDSLHTSVSNAFADRLDRVYPPGDGAEKIQVFHKMGRRGPVWDLLCADGRTRRRGKTSTR